MRTVPLRKANAYSRHPNFNTHSTDFHDVHMHSEDELISTEFPIRCSLQALIEGLMPLSFGLMRHFQLIK